MGNVIRKNINRLTQLYRGDSIRNSYVFHVQAIKYGKHQAILEGFYIGGKRDKIYLDIDNNIVDIKKVNGEVKYIGIKSGGDEKVNLIFS